MCATGQKYADYNIILVKLRSYVSKCAAAIWIAQGKDPHAGQTFQCGAVYQSTAWHRTAVWSGGHRSVKGVL